MNNTDIQKNVRDAVYMRDGFDGWPCCIYCGSPYNIEIHHFVERSRGGMGVKENLVCLCNKCHRRLHDGDFVIKNFAMEYLKRMYPGWEEGKLIYRRNL